ncbi:hypothetical protein [Bartonella koehlerae]|uniref:Uncharacterized protein n=1 Tax=Bartonella koehlerae C-29 TaxID=1134510 RepID=A0A067WA59_9HYPH|nr:hypothetical protein [Bartonella koehlerae]KEC55791.1 hypothetical protein O9A_00569 [Bartonella koehlerae C-29]
MFRPLLKLMAFIFVTLTIIVLAIDIAHSVSISHWTTTPFNTMLVNFLQTDIYRLNQSIRNIMPPFLSLICITLICLPGWFILGALSIGLCLLNYKKPKPFNKISYT